MLKTLHFLFALIWLAGNSFSALAEKIPTLPEKLKEAGFENIRTRTLNNVCYVSIENKVYRSDAHGVTTALDLIVEALADSLEVQLLLLENDVPQVLLSVNAKTWTAFRNKSLSKETFAEEFRVTREVMQMWSKLKPTASANKGKYKADLLIYPDFAYENRRLDKIYETRFGIAPLLKHSFWRGNEVNAQLIFPIHNELGHEGDYIRPGYLTLSQEFLPADRWVVKLTAGNFSHNRYGIHGQLNHNLSNENWNLELDAGYTGSSYFYEHRWSKSALNTFTGSASLSWLYPEYNLQLKGGVARYINNDTGIYATVKRYFRNAAIEFYAQYSSDNLNGGVNLSIPLPPRKRSRIKNSILLTLPEDLYFSYNAGTESHYGQFYRPEYVVNKIKIRKFPLLIKNQIINYIK